MYSVDLCQKSPSMIWSSSDDLDIGIDVSSMVLVKHVWDEKVYSIKIAKPPTLRYTVSSPFQQREYASCLPDVGLRRGEKQNKERDETYCVMREKLGPEVNTMHMTKSSSFLDFMVKCLSHYSGSTIAKSPWLCFGICSKCFQIVFVQSQ